jgi:hypothetical protein
MEHRIMETSRRRGRWRARCSCGETIKGANAIELSRNFELHEIDDHHREEQGL